MNQTVVPPQWAEALLQWSLKQSDREAVSGDLLEEYRDTIVPARGERSADTWYVRQVAWYLLRATWLWALVFSGGCVARTAFDWLVPTTDFVVRSAVTTYVGIGTLLLVGFWAAWRSGSAIAGLVVTVIASQVAAVFSVVGATVLLILLRSPQLFRAIDGSGGIGEVYLLPFMMIVPAIVLGTVAGTVGSMSRKLLR